MGESESNTTSFGVAAGVVELSLAARSAWNERWSVRLQDAARVEAVVYRGDTLCVSSQVGCAVRCTFCASGQNGLARQLTLEELIGQVQAVRDRGVSLSRVTVSGVGEPLHNPRAVREFLTWCQAQRIRMSLTTSGGPLSRLREWLHAPHNGLTLSVHAGTEATRARLLPNAPPLAAMFALLRDELPRMTQRRRKKTALAFLVIDGENAADPELDAFSTLAAPLGLRVHLYAYNPLPGVQHAGVTRARYEQIYQRLSAAGLRVSMSSRARVEINGGCGTLVAFGPATPTG